MAEVQLTYQELAKRLNIKLDSARKLVRRKRWPRTTGNDGTTRILVSLDDLKDTSPPDIPEDIRTDAPSDKSLSQDHEKDIKIARLEAELKGANNLIEAERNRANAEANRA
ncbi:hypothetical protein ACQKP1_25730, partial [Allorhizobium sp. NPDC080224]